MRSVLPLIVLSLVTASCAGTIRSRARYGDQLVEAGDFAKAEKVYESELAQPLAYDEWLYARNGLCKAREARARQLLAGPITTWNDQEVMAFREELLRCPALVALDNQFAAVLLGRNLERLEALQPLIDEGRLWDALAAAVPAWSALPPDNPKVAWFADLKDRTSAQLTVRAAEWRDVPLASAVLLELARLAGGSDEATNTEPVALAKARLAGRRIASTREVSPDCQPYFLATQKADVLPVDPADAAIEIAVSGCTETLVLVDDTETYTVMEERSVEVTRMVQEERTTSRPITTSRRSCSRSGAYDVCTTYTSTSYQTTTEYVSVPVKVIEKKMVEVEHERPIKRLRRQLRASAQVRVRFHDGERTDSVAREVSAIDGRFEATTRQASATPGLFRGQNEELREKLLAAAEASTQAIVLARNTEAWLARARDAEAAGKSRAAVDALLTVNLGNPGAGASAAEFIGAALSLSAATFRPYAPPVVRDIVLENKVLVAREYRYEQSYIPNVLDIGYAPVSLSGGLQGRRAPEIAGQPTRSGVSGIYEMRMDVAGFMTQKHLGLALYAPLSFRLELGKRTSEVYEYPMTGSIVTQEGYWDAGIDTSLGALAGYRARSVGLFVGAIAAYQGHVLGAYRSSSVQLPITARFELRLRQRYPLLLDVWGLDVRGGDEYTRGARLEIPLRTNRWLTAGLRETRAESQTRGLSDSDYVALGATSLFSASLGMTFGF